MRAGGTVRAEDEGIGGEMSARVVCRNRERLSVHCRVLGLAVVACRGKKARGCSGLTQA